MKNQYFLMNKNTIVAEITSDWKLEHINAPLPLGMSSFEDWIENRKACKHNESLKKIMADLGCDKKEGFIKATNCSSLNDTYWVYDILTDRKWDNINLYDNKFNDVISKLAFEGYGLYGGNLSTTVPELTSTGSYKKCWKRLDNTIYLFKQGKDFGMNSGLEPYYEVMASEIIDKVCTDSVKYSLSMLYNKMTSKCELFTNKDIGYIPLSKIMPINISFEDIYNYYYKLGAEEKFREMMVMDAVTFNVDRHLGNIGIFVNNDTQTPLDIATNFDFNLSLLPYMLEDEFDDIGSKLLDYGPRIGTDFTRLGQEMLTDKIKDNLKELRDFKFSFRGDKKFTAERVNNIENILHAQIDAILSKEKLKTKDVFIPNKISNLVFSNYDNTEEIKKADNFLNIVSNGITNITDDNHIECIFTKQSNSDKCFYDIIISMYNDDISLYQDGIETDISNLPNDILNVYTDICNKYDNYTANLENNINFDK